MSKKTLLLTSGIVTLVLLAIGTFGTYKICNNSEICINILHYFFLYFLPFLPLFILALITYKMRDEVYRAWLRFSYVWVPLSMLLILLAPEYTTDWMYPVVKGTVAFFSSILYLVISLVLIVIKSLLLRGK